ncbi:D-Ala-D-Ala carboxypeptidase family metallohydrolase [Falsiroseomonas selenitidurans]|uniref:D-Ala-D-Ala carboxypeptidase family metallohydrolase n=1 Tax=Falsiroseomonas selenitidurans TaxID=2716335 RepID=UPI001ADEAA1B|nr:D-Ala-D-Ala carboxypeptidase family metallohydrolase [Falsiroseomonas selenitidurans]
MIAMAWQALCRGDNGVDYSQRALAEVIRTKSDILLTPHFRLSELLATSHKSIDNWPVTPETIQKLRYCCIYILEKVRSKFGRPVTVNSGFRSPALNAKIGGSKKSQHMQGEAVDFEVPGVANGDICRWIKANLVHDQLILEFYTQGAPSSGWVHCSVVPTGNRMQVLTAVKEKQSGKTTYLPGLHI